MPQRFLSVFSLLVIAFLSAQIVSGISAHGLSTDEPIHVNRTQTWVATGWFVPSRFLEQGEPKPNIAPGRIRAYGPAWSATGHVLNVVAGVEEWGKPNNSGVTLRRSVSAALGIATALAVAFAVGSMTTVAAGLWAGAAVLAIPAWAGYAMFHPKDVAVGAGFTMLSAGLAAGLAGTRYWGVVAALCAFGLLYGIGTRPAMWLPFAGLVLAFAVLTWLRGSGNRISVWAGIVIGAIGVAIIQPKHIADLHAFFVGTIRVSADFPVASSRTTHTAGQLLLAAGGPWWYLPAWVGTAIPLAIMALSILGLTLLVFRKSWGYNLLKRLTHREAGALFFAAQALALPVASIIAGSAIYGGLRQHLYALPAIAGLAGIGAAALLAWRPNWIVASLLAAAILIPTIEQSRLFPYNFTYRNLLAHPVEGNWETDMHLVSRREAIQLVPKGARVYCKRHGGPAANCSYRGEQGTGQTLPPDERYWLIMRVDAGLLTPPDCRDHGGVIRPLRWERITMTRIMLCDSDPRVRPVRD